MTGLVVGSMAPDFEYFLRMNVGSVYSHHFWGLFYFDLPVGIVLTFLFHGIARNDLIDNLPNSLKSKFIDLKSVHWNQLFGKNWPVIILSIFIGSGTHILWDGFTHPLGYFVMNIPLLRSKIHFLGFDFLLYNLLQFLSSVFGFLILSWFIFHMQDKKIEENKDKFGYWGTVIFSMVVVLVVHFRHGLHIAKYGNIVVSVITAFFISIILFPLLRMIRSREKRWV